MQENQLSQNLLQRFYENSNMWRVMWLRWFHEQRIQFQNQKLIGD